MFKAGESRANFMPSHAKYLFLPNCLCFSMGNGASWVSCLLTDQYHWITTPAKTTRMVAMLKAYFRNLHLLIFPAANRGVWVSNESTWNRDFNICSSKNVLEVVHCFSQFCTTTSCNRWERQGGEEVERETHFATNFGGATRYVLRFNLALQIQNGRVITVLEPFSTRVARVIASKHM